MPTPRSFPPTLQAVIADFIPICRTLAGDQAYAIAVSGSLGKGTWDQRSDVDFRLYTPTAIPWRDPVIWGEYNAAAERWKQAGVTVDGIWPRATGEIDAALDEWCAGKAGPPQLIWTIWGYHLLPDIAHQHIVEDPYGILAAWKARLAVYPPLLKQAILDKNLASLRYWRADYHYQNKVERGDVVFLAGLTAKLIHEILQALFALNQTYFVGDGSNLTFAEKFDILPPDFSAKVRAILYPGGDNPLQTQANALTTLIDEVMALAA